MTKKAPIPVRERKVITVYPDPELRKKLEDAAQAESRSLGAMLAEIAKRYFAQKADGT